MKKMISLNVAGALLIGALLSLSAPAKAQNRALITHFPAMIGSRTNIVLSSLPDQGIQFAWIENDRHFRTFFDKSGAWTGTVVSYEEAAMPDAVHRRVKAEYSRFTIRFINEIRLPGRNIVYRVQLENAREIVFAQVEDGEISEEDRLAKLP